MAKELEQGNIEAYLNSLNDVMKLILAPDAHRKERDADAMENRLDESIERAKEVTE